MKLIDIAILTKIKGLGPANMTKILNYCKSNYINSVYELKNIDLSKVVSTKLANIIETYLDTDIDNLYKNMQNLIDGYKLNDIHCISINDELYPEILKESTNPPVILYCKGNIDLLNSNCVAVIGTRENTHIGETIASKTVEFLVQNNFTIVSGLAKGIDTIAHKTTLQNKGKTIAIIPLIDSIYPTENKALADEILISDGLLISEEKPNTKFFSAQLVKRDRIQSGLSKAIFIVETKINGGSMHAVKDAIEHKKLVYSPNVSSFDDSYKLNQQVEGILKLQRENLSIAYSSKDYISILEKLKRTKVKQQSLF